MQDVASLLRDRDFVQPSEVAQTKFKPSVAGALHRTPRPPREQFDNPAISP
jgi:hypothetical protein